MTSRIHPFGVASMIAAACFGLAQAKVIREESRVPVSIATESSQYQRDVSLVTYVDDETATPRPIAVVVHGRAGTAADRERTASSAIESQVRWLAKLGFLVAFPARIGYGSTGGEDFEESGPCSDKKYAPGFRAATQQIAQVISHLRQGPDVMKDRVLLVGYSYGGAVALGTSALRDAGIAAVVAFAPGAGVNPMQPGVACMAGRMEELFTEYGAAARSPVLWINAENDTFFGPAQSLSWYTAFTKNGAKAEQVVMPPQGEQGHYFFLRGQATWEPIVLRFLQQQKLAPMQAPPR
ncbi:MAG: dienelactone hydrolase family protein [Betaproteobacteria bacterium]